MADELAARKEEKAKRLEVVQGVDVIGREGHELGVVEKDRAEKATEKERARVVQERYDEGLEKARANLAQLVAEGKISPVQARGPAAAMSGPAKAPGEKMTPAQELELKEFEARQKMRGREQDGRGLARER